VKLCGPLQQNFPNYAARQGLPLLDVMIMNLTMESLETFLDGLELFDDVQHCVNLRFLPVISLLLACKHQHVLISFAHCCFVFVCPPI